MQSLKNHLKVAGIALVFGLTAYMCIYALMYAIYYVEKI